MFCIRHYKFVFFVIPSLIVIHHVGIHVIYKVFVRMGRRKMINDYSVKLNQIWLMMDVVIKISLGGNVVGSNIASDGLSKSKFPST